MSARRLLVLRPLGLGDFLTGLPSLRALVVAFPDHEVILAAPPALDPLARLSGTVDRLVPARPLAPLPAELAGVDVAVDLHGRGPESHRVLLELEPGRLIAFENRQIPESRGMPRWRADEHEVLRWCRLLAEAGVPADPRALELERPPGAAAIGEGATIVHPGAASEARRWPAERFAAVARAEAAGGRRVLVTGARRELALTERVASEARLPAESVLAGRTDLLQLAALVADAARVVCGDTGVAHLATAFGTPSVVLCGPIPPRLWGPPPDRPVHIALWAGRSGDPHARTPDPGLLAIGVPQVLAALAWLDRSHQAVA